MKTIEERIYDGNRAKEVLENPAFVAVFDDIENEVLETWKTSPARDSEGREKLYIYLHLLQKVKARLTSSLDTGKLAVMDLEHKKTLAERIGMPWSRF